MANGDIIEIIKINGLTFKIKEAPYGGWLDIYYYDKRHPYNKGIVQSFKTLPECRGYLAENSRLWSLMNTPARRSKSDAE